MPDQTGDSMTVTAPPTELPEAERFTTSAPSDFAATSKLARVRVLCS